jgi:heme exporter protein D
MNSTPKLLSELPPLSDFWKDIVNSPDAKLYLVWVVVGISVLVLAVVIIMAAKRTGGKSKHRHRHRRRHHRGSGQEMEGDSTEKTGEGAAELPRPGMRRRTATIINPTLAQTGGLPPKREDGAPPPNLP